MATSKTVLCAKADDTKLFSSKSVSGGVDFDPSALPDANKRMSFSKGFGLS